MNFLFSIVVPVYNVELYIEKCLLSCLNQEHVSADDYQIIIVNDGTKDSSIVLAKEIVHNYPKHHIKFIERENGGLSAARNTGLKHVEGKYIWFVDSDDWIVSDALSSLKQKIEVNNSPQIITFTHLTAYEDGTFSKEIIGTDSFTSGFDYLANNNFLSSCTCIYAANFLKENNFTFKEGMLWEDSEFNLRVYSLVKKHYFYNKPLYYYLRRASSITTNGTSYKMVNSWFIKIDSVYSYFKDKKLATSESNIINHHLASTIVAAVAGLPDLPQKERAGFEQKIKSQKKYYWQFFRNSNDLKMKISGLLILLSLPLAEVLFRFIVKRAMKKGEGR
jgi:glycosyltransferase involved in cell wall biosynthesis